MKELLEEIERKWNMKENEYDTLMRERDSLKSDNETLAQQIVESNKLVAEYKMKWNELMKKIHGEMDYGGKS